MARIVSILLLVAVSLRAQLSQGSWRTDLSKKSIELSELKSGGPPKDGIPAIDGPKFVSPKEASIWLHAKEPVMVVEHAGEARAYPLQILMWHELVNDRMGDLPILVSYCPLCNSALVFDRRLDGKLYDFGVSGMLRESDMVMYDRQTDSLWQQITGEAIVGQLTGKTLTVVGSHTVSFEAFARNFPEGRVLSRETGHQRAYGQNPYVGYEFGNRLIMPVSRPSSGRVRPLERIVAITMDGKTRAYPFEYLKQRGVVEEKFKGQRFVIFHEDGTLTPLDDRRIANSRDVGAAGVFSPELDGKRLSFRRKDGKIVDKQTNSSWNVLGKAIEGPLAGKRLQPIEHGIYFAFAWMVFRPDTEIVGVGTRLEDGAFPKPSEGRFPDDRPAGGLPPRP